jgi:hypothetical protein
VSAGAAAQVKCASAVTARNQRKFALVTIAGIFLRFPHQPCVCAGSGQIWLIEQHINGQVNPCGVPGFGGYLVKVALSEMTGKAQKCPILVNHQAQGSSPPTFVLH